MRMTTDDFIRELYTACNERIKEAKNDVEISDLIESFERVAIHIRTGKPLKPESDMLWALKQEK